MWMLMVINLYVIDMIFGDAESIISANAKMLYINCLMHHFRLKKANIANAIAFDLFYEDFKDYDKYKKSLQELHKAGLLTMGDKTITFNNLWGQYIDKSLLEKVAPDEYIAGFQFQPVSKFKEDLMTSQSISDLSQMKYKLTKIQVSRLVELFIAEQTTFDKVYHNFGDCKKHFINWLFYNSDKIPNQNQNKPKILGL